MKRSILLSLALGLTFITSVQAQKKPGVFYTSGNYRGIVMTSKASGDYGGVDVYLTQTDTETFALVTRAEGVPLRPVLVKATMSGKDNRTISFTVPIDGAGKMKFRGHITAAGLKFDEGTEEEGLFSHVAMLKRTCGGTYSDISLGKQSGDYGGIEVYLTDSDGSWYALVQTAEGLIGKPQLVEVKMTGTNANKVEFTVPIDRGGRHLTGTISTKAGTLTLKDDDGSKTVLKSKCYK